MCNFLAMFRYTSAKVLVEMLNLKILSNAVKLKSTLDKYVKENIPESFQFPCKSTKNEAKQLGPISLQRTPTSTVQMSVQDTGMLS